MLRVALVCGGIAAIALLAVLSGALAGGTAPFPARGAPGVAVPARPPVVTGVAPKTEETIPPPARDPALARALAADAEAYPPLPEPEIGDWLAAHPDEPGQTFEEWRTGRRRTVLDDRRTIRLLPLEEGDPVGVPLATVAEFLAAFYGLPAVVSPVPRPPEFTTRVNPGTGKKQTLTRDVLNWLQNEVPSDSYCVIALTGRDLYPDPTWNFVFGEALLVGRAGVFSFARMTPEFPRPPPAMKDRSPQEQALVLRRCLKVVTHEVGHMFGMEHCRGGLCLMNGSNHVPEMDRAPLFLCPVCLEKVQHATKLDVVERYRRLAEFCGRAGLSSEAEWFARRMRIAAGT